MDYFKRIIKLFTTHEVSTSERYAFYKWLIDKEHAMEKDRSLKGLWDHIPVNISLSTWRSLNSVKEKAGISSRRRKTVHSFFRPWFAAALGLLVVCLSLYYFYFSKDSHTSPDLIEQYVPIAEMSYMTLPDGSQVQLNSKSVLLYPKSFDSNSRSVYLMGEANFKVKSDIQKPFVVKSSGFQITVLGTEFNVLAYPDDSIVMVTVLSGRVKVEYDSLRLESTLFPNQQWAYNKYSRQHDVHNPNMDDVTAWQRGELVFRGTTLYEIITMLERKYPYSFTYSLNKLKDDRFTFRFRKNATLPEIMDIVVQVVGDLQYKIENNTIIIY